MESVATLGSGRAQLAISSRPVRLRRMRLDKWLWAARFFKTRSQASEAVDGGHIEVNGDRAKPAKQLAIGDELRIRQNQTTFVVHVQGFSERRGPASEARALYVETAASVAERERLAE